MSTYDDHSPTLENNVTVTTQDITDKIDGINRTLASIIAETLAQDLKDRLDGIDTLLTRLEVQQNKQGQDIKDVKHPLDSLEWGLERLDGIGQRFEGVDRRLGGIDQRLGGSDQRLGGVDRRFIYMEEKFDKRFEQVFEILATLTNKP